jgi:hypothetical protein
MRRFTTSTALALIGLIWFAHSQVLGPTVHAQSPAQESEPSELEATAASGAAPVNGVITYTYYVGTSPTGKPLPGPPVNAGTYTVVATFRSADGNFTGGSACTTFTIQKATPVINLQHPGGTYNGTPMPATGAALTNRPAKVEVDESGVPILTETPSQGGARKTPPPRRLPSERSDVPPPPRGGHTFVTPPATSPSSPRGPVAAHEVPRVEVDESGVPILNEGKPVEARPAAPAKAPPTNSEVPVLPDTNPRTSPEAKAPGKPMPSEKTDADSLPPMAAAAPIPEPLAAPTPVTDDSGNPYFTGKGTVVWPPGLMTGPTNSDDHTPADDPAHDECTLGPRVWFGAEYLMWWIKGSPLPFPLVTSSSAPGTNLSGSLGQPGTSVLYGGHDADMGMFSGLRLVGGGWIDADERFGVEGEILLLQNQNASFSAASNAAGSPSLYVPAFNTQLQAERALVIADPVSALAGNVAIASSSRLWGAGITGLANLLRNQSTSIDMLCGFRYLDLTEGFDLSNTTSSTFGVTDTLRDGFDTSNQFYGATLGTRVAYERGPLVFTFTEKVALGATHEVVRITGGITESGAGAPSPGTFPGGFFTQPSNIGVLTRDPFSVVPEFQFRTGYRFRRYLTAFISYDFIYWTNVARPGDQIDRNLNLSQSPVFGTTGGVLVGAPSPRPLFTRSDFWAQGISLGLSLRY